MHRQTQIRVIVAGEEFTFITGLLINHDISLSQDTCLDKIAKGLQLHLNLLKELMEATMLSQTDQVTELQADIQELVLLIEEVSRGHLMIPLND